MKTLMIASFLLTLYACGDNPVAKGKIIDSSNPSTAVVRIGYKHYGGMAGLDITLSIMQSSTLYSYALYIDGSENRRLEEPTEKEAWEKLLAELDVEAFKKIKSGGSHLPVDGTDQEFFIATASGEEYSFINGDQDEHYKKLQPFFDYMFSILNQCSTNSLPQKE